MSSTFFTQLSWEATSICGPLSTPALPSRNAHRWLVDSWFSWGYRSHPFDALRELIMGNFISASKRSSQESISLWHFGKPLTPVLFQSNCLYVKQFRENEVKIKPFLETFMWINFFLHTIRALVWMQLVRILSGIELKIIFCAFRSQACPMHLSASEVDDPLTADKFNWWRQNDESEEGSLHQCTSPPVAFSGV